MKKIFNLFLLSLSVISLSSCLKDDTIIGPDSPGSKENLIEFANLSAPISRPTVSTAAYPAYVKWFDLSPTDNFLVTVNYAGKGNAPENITVKVVMDNTLLEQYNDKIIAVARAQAIAVGDDPNAAEAAVADQLFEILDPTLYTLPTSMDVTIPAGQKTASFTVNVKPDQFVFDKNTAIGLKIISASKGTISGNYSSIIVKIGAKNRMDGVYNYKTSAVTDFRPNANDSGVILTTSGPNSVETYLANTYANRMTYTVDPVTNRVISVTGWGTPIVDPSSNYDPVQKVLYVKWTQGVRQFDETYTYTGPRS